MRMSSSSFHTNIYLVSKDFAFTTGGDISLPGRYKGQGKACLMIPSLDHELKGSRDCFPSLKESCVKYFQVRLKVVCPNCEQASTHMYTLHSSAGLPDTAPVKSA